MESYLKKQAHQNLLKERRDSGSGEDEQLKLRVIAQDRKIVIVLGADTKFRLEIKGPAQGFKSCVNGAKTGTRGGQPVMDVRRVRLPLQGALEELLCCNVFSTVKLNHAPIVKRVGVARQHSLAAQAGVGHSKVRSRTGSHFGDARIPLDEISKLMTGFSEAATRELFVCALERPQCGRFFVCRLWGRGRRDRLPQRSAEDRLAWGHWRPWQGGFLGAAGRRGLARRPLDRFLLRLCQGWSSRLRGRGLSGHSLLLASGFNCRSLPGGLPRRSFRTRAFGDRPGARSSPHRHPLASQRCQRAWRSGARGSSFYSFGNRTAHLKPKFMRPTRLQWPMAKLISLTHSCL